MVGPPLFSAPKPPGLRAKSFALASRPPRRLWSSSIRVTGLWLELDRSSKAVRFPCIPRYGQDQPCTLSLEMVFSGEVADGILMQVCFAYEHPDPLM